MKIYACLLVYSVNLIAKRVFFYCPKLGKSIKLPSNVDDHITAVKSFIVETNEYIDIVIFA